MWQSVEQNENIHDVRVIIRLPETIIFLYSDWEPEDSRDTEEENNTKHPQIVSEAWIKILTYDLGQMDGTFYKGQITSQISTRELDKELGSKTTFLAGL